MSTFSLTNSTFSNLSCTTLDNTTTCDSLSYASIVPLSTNISLSSFEIILIAACSSFLTLIFAGLFNFLKINITQQRSQWSAPCKPNFNEIIKQLKQSYTAQAQQQQHKRPESTLFPPQNRYYPIVSSAYKLFVEAMNGTERDGWIYQGEKKGVKKYKKDIHSSALSLYRGEKVLDYPQNILIHAIRDKRVRLLVGDGQMKDCGPLEIIDANCKIEFEEYRSPAPFVEARDFVYIDTIHRLNDETQTVLSFARSVLHPGRPKSNKFTRADLKIGGWALRKIPDEPNKTKVLYLVRCDLGGALPTWLVNQITSDIPITVERLNTALKKIGDLQQFNKPLMDVLLYGPKPLQLDINEEEKETVHETMGNGVLSAKYSYPATTEQQKRRFAAILRENKDLWSSREYLDLIPSDKDWIKRKPILIHGIRTRQQHEELLDHFVIPDKPFKYSADLEQALALFNKWRKLSGWKEKAQKEDLTIYSHVSGATDDDNDIIKGEAVINYSVPLIAGILLNSSHRRKWDHKLEEIVKVNKCSEYCSIVYLSVKTPTIFITYRDMVTITFVYPLLDGSLLMGSRSVIHDRYPPKKTRVRARIDLDVWHLRPHYDVNPTHSLVTHYAHIALGGSLPNWIVNEAGIDIPSGILKVRNYMNEIYAHLHEPGVLHIPPWPLLKCMGVDIGWMDRDSHTDGDREEKCDTIIEEKCVSAAVYMQSAADVSNAEEEDVMVSNIKSSKLKSPNVNYVVDRARKLSGIDVDKLSTTSSSLRRRKSPNYNLIANPNTNSMPPPSSQHIATVSNTLVITRSEWEKGAISLRLGEIGIITEHKNDMEEKGENYKYSLMSNLSLRDRASYMTLGNCAVSELLQETDGCSKEYWVPSDSKTPRGIFVYKFIHSGERYYHYMGKAILHHEPSFIYEAICDPSFRFRYDKMLDEMQIIDKLDDSTLNKTYLARYLHTAKQCYFSQRRETIVVVKHRCVDVNNKYVAAGMSIEHKDFPTDSHQLQRSTSIASDSRSGSRNEQSRESAKSSNAKQLCGKGPSKSINSGILRMDIKSSGWVIERNVKKPSDSIVSYITNINFGGSLPSALLKGIAKKQPLAIFYLGKALKQRAKQIRKKKRELRQKRQEQQQKEQQQQPLEQP